MCVTCIASRINHSTNRRSRGNFFPACHFNAKETRDFKFSWPVTKILLVSGGNFHFEVSPLKLFKRVSPFSFPGLLIIAAAIAFCSGFLAAQQTLGGITGEVAD